MRVHDPYLDHWYELENQDEYPARDMSWSRFFHNQAGLKNIRVGQDLAAALDHAEALILAVRTNRTCTSTRGGRPVGRRSAGSGRLLRHPHGRRDPPILRTGLRGQGPGPRPHSAHQGAGEGTKEGNVIEIKEDLHEVPPLQQIDATVYPTRTVYRFGDSQVALSLTFLTPALPADLEALARPVTYLVWEVYSVDGRPHAVQLYFDAVRNRPLTNRRRKSFGKSPPSKGSKCSGSARKNNPCWCISTVDVLFPQAPFYMIFSPALTKGMLVPVLDYASSPAWPYPYATHDLGTYPHATGQVYGMRGGDGGRMPVEESDNMLIMLAALARVEGNADFARKYWPLLTRWADYLAANGLDPQNQLCSADMFGHLPHCANLALKAIIGLGGYAQMCRQVGRPEDAKRYFSLARRYAVRWQEMARDDGRTRLAYHLPGTWGMKHNLIWDRVLETDLFPVAVGDAEVAWHLKVQKRYGSPVHNRAPPA